MESITIELNAEAEREPPGNSANFSPFVLFYLFTLLSFFIAHYSWKRLFVTFDGAGISGQITRRQFIDIPWSDVSIINFKLFSIVIRTRSNKVIIVPTPELTFEDQHRLKPLAIAFIQAKGVPIQAP